MSTQAAKKQSKLLLSGSLARGPSGSAFTTCPSCGNSVSAALLSFHLTTCAAFCDNAGSNFALMSQTNIVCSRGSPAPSGLSDPISPEKSDQREVVSISEESETIEEEVSLLERKKRLFDDDWGWKLSSDTECSDPLESDDDVCIDSQPKRLEVDCLGGALHISTQELDFRPAIRDSQEAVPSQRAETGKVANLLVANCVDNRTRVCDVQKVADEQVSGGNGGCCDKACQTESLFSDMEEDLLRSREEVLELQSKLKEAQQKDGLLECALQFAEDEVAEIRGKAENERKKLVSVRNQLESLTTDYHLLDEQFQVLKDSEHTAQMVLVSLKASVEKDQALIKGLKSSLQAMTVLYKALKAELAVLISKQTMSSLRANSEKLETIPSSVVAKYKMQSRTVSNEDEMLATQIMSQSLVNPTSSPVPCMWHKTTPAIPANADGMESDKLRKISSNCLEFNQAQVPAEVPVENTTTSNSLSKPAKGIENFDGCESAGINSLGHLQQSCPSELAPRTPGKVLSAVNDSGRNDDVQTSTAELALTNVSCERVLKFISTPGPKTPEKAASTLGGNEKTLISELLQNFPPAHGGEDRDVIDPFEDKFLADDTEEEVDGLVIVTRRNKGKRRRSAFSSDSESEGKGFAKSNRTQGNGNECNPSTRTLHGAKAEERNAVDSDNSGTGKERRISQKANLDTDTERDTTTGSIDVAQTTVQSVEKKSGVVKGLFQGEGEQRPEPRMPQNFLKRRRLVKTPALDVADVVHSTVARVCSSVTSSGGNVELKGQADSEVHVRDSNLRRSTRLMKKRSCSRNLVTCPEPIEGENEGANDEKVVNVSSRSSSEGELNSPKKERADARISGSRQRFVSMDLSPTRVEQIYSEDESFINDDPDVDETTTSGYTNSSNETVATESSGPGSASDEEPRNYDWELEGDMLASLAKDPELCLRGMRALYRRQEDDEKQGKDARYRNGRGFDRFHASKASRIAELFTGVAANGQVQKTAAYWTTRLDESTLNYCQDTCIRHSRQLFEIYQNNEDPHFPGG